MEETKIEALLKMLNITTDILKNNPTLNTKDQQECLNIIGNILEQLNSDSDLTPEHVHFIENILHQMDALKPLSYMYVRTVPFFIYKSWVRFQ